MISGPVQKRALDLGWIGMAVRSAVGQDMPDDDQDLTRDNGDSLLRTFVGLWGLVDYRK